jgi:hypothetical protein
VAARTCHDSQSEVEASCIYVQDIEKMSRRYESE